MNNKLISAQVLQIVSGRIYALLGIFLSLLVELTSEKCVNCGALEDNRSSTERKLMYCSRCHCVLYCSRDCQTVDFSKKRDGKNNGHKKNCKKLTVLKERYEDRHPVPTFSMADTCLYLETFLYNPKLRDTVILTLKEDIYSKARAADPRLRSFGK